MFTWKAFFLFSISFCWFLRIEFSMITPSSYPREETQEEATRRFEIECEFVQSLANPHYLNCKFTFLQYNNFKEWFMFRFGSTWIFQRAIFCQLSPIFALFQTTRVCTVSQRTFFCLSNRFFSSFLGRSNTHNAYFCSRPFSMLIFEKRSLFQQTRNTSRISYCCSGTSICENELDYL